MKKKLPVVYLAAACVALFLILAVLFGRGGTFPDAVKSMLAGFFAEKFTAEQLKGDYAYAGGGQTSKKIKVLIIPGHNENSPGAAFRNLREVDMTVELGESLYALFKDNGHYDTVLSRGTSGDNPDFIQFFNSQRENIARIRNEKRAAMENYISSGLVRKEEPLPHAEASEETALRLYALNMWADSIGVSIVINIHFNDYPRIWSNTPGEYDGFAIYIPSKEYGNARVSLPIAEKIFGYLSRYYHVSTYPEESSGIIPDQELISLGANDTLKAASLLIEYGYIYEPQFRYGETRKIVTRDLALKTYLGVQDFFGGASPAIKDTAILPYLWTEDIRQGDKGKASVLALQAALLNSGFYPPAGKSKGDCPLSGTFKECTKNALSAFQEKNKIPADGSVAGPKTRQVLNRLFGV